MTDNGAVQALVASATKVPLPDGTRRVRLQNLGPNFVYYASTAAKCTSALGMQIPITRGTIDFDVGGHELYIRTVTADQTTPADTRWYVLGG